MKRSIGCIIVAVGLSGWMGCSRITMLRVEELRQVQARVDSLSARLSANQQQMLKEQKSQGELLRVVRADMQVRFGELAQRVSQIEGGMHESQERLSDIDRKTAEIRERWQEQARIDSVRAAMDRAEEENLFQIAYSDFTAGRHDLALAGFRDFTQRYPESDLVEKARYWSAECHYAQKQYDSAEVAYTGYIKEYPQGAKICPTFYKLGLVYEKKGKAKHKKLVWDKVLEQCPQSEEARAVAGRQ
jgi:tol-pal system protein YbgF